MSNAAWLSGKQPNGEPARWLLDKDEILVGREAPADIVFPVARVSREHARLTCNERGYYVSDLDSRNGTFVNGKRLGREPYRLTDGDEIVFGGAIALHFHDPGETLGGPLIGRLKGVWIDEAAHDVWVDARKAEPPLSAAQLSLLSLLYHSSGQVVSRAQIIAAVWPEVDPAGVSEEAVDGLIKRLRARLRETQPEKDYLEVLRGHGLRLNQPQTEDP